MSRLYEISAQYEYLDSLVEEGMVTEEDLSDTRKLLDEDRDAYLDNLTSVIKNKIHEKNGVDAAKKELEARSKSLGSTIDFLKHRLVQAMQLLKSKKFSSARHRFHLQETQKLIVSDEDEVFVYLRQNHPECITVKTETLESIQANAVKELINSGKKIPGAVVQTNFTPVFK